MYLWWPLYVSIIHFGHFIHIEVLNPICTSVIYTHINLSTCFHRIQARIQGNHCQWEMRPPWALGWWMVRTGAGCSWWRCSWSPCWSCWPGWCSTLWLYFVRGGRGLGPRADRRPTGSCHWTWRTRPWQGACGDPSRGWGSVGEVEAVRPRQGSRASWPHSSPSSHSGNIGRELGCEPLTNKPADKG